MYVHNNQHIAYTARTYTLLEEGEGFTNCTHAEKEGERGRVEIIFLISHTVHITNTKLYVQCTIVQGVPEIVFASEWQKI